MSKARICDRCGKICDVSSIRSMTFRKILLTASLFYPNANDDSYLDLCADCATELDRFLDGEAIEALIKE